MNFRFLPAVILFLVLISIGSVTYVSGQASVVTGSIATSKTSYTVGIGKNRLLVVAVTGEAASIGTVTSITWGGQNLTQARTQVNGTAFRTDLWYLNEAGISAARSSCSYNFVVNWSAAPTTEIFAAITLQDIDQTTPVAASNSATTASATNLATGNIAVGINDLVVYASSSSQNKTHTAAAGYTERSDQIVGATASMATATKAITVAGTENPSATWSGGANSLINNGVAFNGVSATGVLTYYSRNATLGGNWDDASSWTLNSDGSGGPLSTGVWPTRSDHVVVLSGHTITINATDDNKQCGVSPDGLARSNIGAGGGAGFNGSNLAMFYQTGDITINGTVSVTGGVNMMVEGYTHVTSTGTYSLTSYLVNVGYLEADASSTLTTLDDLSLTGNSITIINTNSTTADDLNIDFTDATLCGTGTSTLLNSGGSAINYTNSATVNQICTTFVVNCSGGGCSGFPVTGTGTSIGNTGPGGVDKNDGTGFLEFWLDSQDVNADGTNPANGSAVVTWSDKSGNNVDVTQNIANVATYSASGVTFNNTGYLLGSDATFPSGGAARTAYVCASTPNTTADDVLFFYGNDAASQSYGILKSTAENVRNYFYGNDLDDAGGWLPAGQTKVVNTRYASTFQEIFVDGTSTATKTATPATTIGADGVQIGGWSAFSLNSNATIKEVLLYSKAINNAERIIIDNYLAAKYGTTLASNDLYTQDNLANGDFDYDVAGVGQASDGTNHKDARGTGIVRMIVQSPSSLGNSEFLLWGHSNGALTSNLIDIDGTIIKERIARVWRISETGDVGSVAVSFDISSLSGSPIGANLRLLIDRDGDGFFDNDVTPISGGTFSGDIITFTGVNFQTGDRFTLGNTDLSNPLPIELLSFSAIAEQTEVKLTWSTASELNNNFFTVQRSQDVEKWQDVIEISAAGNSNERIDYETTDRLPFTGVSYYRLKQTDFDGQYTYSGVRRVDLIQAFQLKVSPNPSSGTFRITTGFEIFSENVRLINTLGQNIPIKLQTDSSSVFVDSGSISPGIYILQVNRGYWRQSVRVVIE